MGFGFKSSCEATTHGAMTLDERRGRLQGPEPLCEHRRAWCLVAAIASVLFAPAGHAADAFRAGAAVMDISPIGFPVIVNAMFTELATKLDAYKLEMGAQHASIAECPTTGPDKTGYNFATTCTTGWSDIRVQPPQSKNYCSYEVVTGVTGSTLTVPAGFLTSQGGTGAEPTLASSWWYILAECDEDGQGGTNSTFYKSSVDGKLQTQNEGK